MHYFSNLIKSFKKLPACILSRLRTLSEGNSVTSPPSSPAGVQKYKLAEHRYGREEMLALFVPSSRVPEELKEAPPICSEKPLTPLAVIPLSDDEQVSPC